METTETVNSTITAIPALVRAQKAYFDSGKTKSYDFRKEQLLKLESLIRANEDRIIAALKKDLHKPAYESLMMEIGPMYSEVAFILKNLRKWMRPKRVPTPLFHFPGSSRIYSEPYGNVLVIAPWNYPFNLVISPVIGAIAAGNCVMIKPSESSQATSALLADMINKNFDPGFLHVIEGAADENKKLLEEKWDYIFFTGGTEIGRKVYQAAAQNLTPVTLELGGKNPCIIDAGVNMELAAKRIMWGKLVNSGQTCLAPDYLFIHASVKDRFVEALKQMTVRLYGENPMQNPDYCSIINKKQYDRIRSYIAEGDVLMGGKTSDDRLMIEPTLLGNVSPESRIMKEEIFGPVLPVFEYTDIDTVIAYIRTHEKPLAAYIFSEDAAVRKKFMKSVSFGGGAMNETLLHIGSSHLPFGGVGASGMGAYHGKFSFDTFSHKKSVLRRGPNMMDDRFRYPPYSESRLNMMRKLIRKFL